MISKDELFDLSQRQIAREDITEIQIDGTLPIAERFEDFLSKIKNPYCFLCDGTPVKLSFSEGGKPLEELICNHFIRNKDGQ